MGRRVKMARYFVQGESSSNEEEGFCPVTYTQNLTAGRWKIIILWQLSQGTTKAVTRHFKRNFNKTVEGIGSRSNGTPRSI